MSMSHRSSVDLCMCVCVRVVCRRMD